MEVSSDFKDGERIPERFTCQGENINPRLELSGVPEEAKCLAIIMDDPDAPMGTFVHWVLWNIPITEEIPEDAKDIGVDGAGTSSRAGYHGPCPPPGHGPHRYFFKIYALDSMLDPEPGSGKKALEDAMQGHVLASAQLMGTFER